MKILLNDDGIQSTRHPNTQHENSFDPLPCGGYATKLKIPLDIPGIISKYKLYDVMYVPYGTKSNRSLPISGSYIYILYIYIYEAEYKQSQCHIHRMHANTSKLNAKELSKP